MEKERGGGDRERRGGEIENERERGEDSSPLQRCKDSVNIARTQTDSSSQQSHILHHDNHTNHCTGLTAVNHRRRLSGSPATGEITSYNRGLKRSNSNLCLVTSCHPGENWPFLIPQLIYACMRSHVHALGGVRTYEVVSR